MARIFREFAAPIFARILHKFCRISHEFFRFFFWAVLPQDDAKTGHPKTKSKKRKKVLGFWGVLFSGVRFVFGPKWLEPKWFEPKCYARADRQGGHFSTTPGPPRQARHGEPRPAAPHAAPARVQDWPATQDAMPPLLIGRLIF